MRALPVLLVASAVGCGAPPLPPPARAPAPARLTRRAQLLYELDGRPFPLPIVRGTLSGRPVTMLVDTGASTHVIAGWLARKLALPMSKLGDIGTDHAGRSLATYEVAHPDLAIEGWGNLEPAPAIATEVPELMEKLGIGVFLSPQRLAEDGDAVVLDLARAEMRAAWWDEEARTMGTTGGVALPAPRACGDGKQGTGLVYVLPGVIAGEHLDLLVDTGALHTDILAGSGAGARLAPSSVADTASLYLIGGKVTIRRLPGVRVEVGAVSETADVEVVPGQGDARCMRDGVLAMDVLRSCKLLLGGATMLGRCAAP